MAACGAAAFVAHASGVRFRSMALDAMGSVPATHKHASKTLSLLTSLEMHMRICMRMAFVTSARVNSCIKAFFIARGSFKRTANGHACVHSTAAATWRSRQPFFDDEPLRFFA